MTESDYFKLDKSPKIKAILITNIPSPYRVLQFDRLSEIFNGDFSVIYHRKIETNRNWTIPELFHRYSYLNNGLQSKFNLYPNILRILFSEDPDIIIVAGFTPTIVLAFFYSWFCNKKLIIFTDSWLQSVNKLKPYHRYIRKFLISKADAHICVGLKGKEYLVCYGANDDSIFISPLAINNTLYSKYYKSLEQKQFDILFSGQFVRRKMPLFVIEVITLLKASKQDVSCMFIGSGPLESEIIEHLKASKINFSCPGYIQQHELPKYYANSKLLLFPTEDDPWGIVANESCAVGTPVITCNNAGVANDLIIHDYNGYVLPLSVNVWVEHVLKLLTNKKLYETFSANALKHVEKYSIENAAVGIINAIDFLLENETITK